MDEQAFDNELDTEGDKKDGENRYSIDSPKKKVEEDTNFNSTTSETKDNSSDLSRPPGLSSMKRSFSSSSNCSTSFARCLVDLPIGGRSFTWMNKAGTKLSKLDRFLISEDVTIRLPDVRITALDRLWSDHNPILLHIDKTDFGPTPFKLYNSWLLRDGFDNLIKEEWELLDSNLKCHEKFRRLKDKIKQWSNNIKTLERNRKTVALEEINSIEKRIDEGSAMPSDNDHRLILLQEIEKIDKFASMDIIQKAHVKWDIEGDENSKFFHGLINQKRRNQMINGIMVEGNWITNPCLIKDAFLQFYKRKFQAQDSQVMFSNLPHSHSLNCMDRETLERQVTLEEIKEAVWDCGSSKAPGPDGYSFAFVKKYWGTIQKDLYDFVNLFFASCVMPNGANSSFFTLIPKVNNPTLITDFRPISLIGIHYKIIAKILANRLSKVIDKIVSKEQSAFIAGRQILDGPVILSEIIEWYKKRKKKLLIFKVDFEKAFDSISWNYLIHILDSFGFGNKWCSWIKACLNSSRASILINGSPTSEFSIKRGLRQGDPLSPFLFILVIVTFLNFRMLLKDYYEIDNPFRVTSITGNEPVMSSASSAVTYTSVYTDSEPGRVFWGADDEEVSEGGVPRVIVYGYDGLPIQPVPQDEDEREPRFIQAPDPDFVPEPVYPEYLPLEDEHVLLAEEQPLPPVDSPTAESPGYVTESDPEEDPEEYEDDETEDGPVDYPMDGGDDGYDDDGDSSRDDAKDEDKDKEDEEDNEEEEHLAPADSAAVVPTSEPVFLPEGTELIIPPSSTDISIVGARISNRLQASISLPPKTKVERLLAMTTPSPSPPVSLSPPSVGERLARCMAPPAHSSPPSVPSPLPPLSRCPTQIQTLRMAYTQALIDAVTAALPSPLLPPLPPLYTSTYTVYHRDDNSLGVRDVGYGIRDTWVDPAEAVPEVAPVTLGEVSTRVVKLAEVHKRDIQDMYALLEDAQDGRSRISRRVDRDSQRVDLLMMDRMTLQETVWMVEEEAYASREAWAHSIGLSQATYQELQTHRDHVYAHETHIQAHQTPLQLQSTDDRDSSSTERYETRLGDMQDELDSQDQRLGFQITRMLLGMPTVTSSDLVILFC
ncbi:putative RNA-directed DNA polymerase, eukaryota, reverse transcriptase zinc-binding domain protein [Tanacetum coccineum]